MNFLDSLAVRALRDDYLKELIYKAEEIYDTDFFGPPEDVPTPALSTKEYSDLLRFADILSQHEGHQSRNIALKIISLLYPRWKSHDSFAFHANAILTRLGNFPSLSLINQDGKDYDVFETELDKIIKSEVQRVPGSEKIFTDSQYTLFEQLTESNHFSFSGPTSFGKSFVMDAFIRYLINSRHGLDNIAILVPTRALINQVTTRLREEIQEDNYKVLSHPSIPRIFNKKDSRFIFVFTPERLISYFANAANPSIQYMFIDEAQKAIQDDDSRTPLYYHAISMADRKSVKLFFASPNIANSDIFLKLFDKSTAESKTILEAPVTQNRYFVDLVNKEQWSFHELDPKAQKILYGGYENLNELIIACGSTSKNIVYCNSVKDTISYALKFAEALPEIDDPEVKSLIKYVKTTIHSEYYLIDCLKKGVAFHFGRLPQRLREKVENLFIDGKINHVFCTSTLLEGVNLPAKNIFILNNKIGLRNFSKIDFWNLAGRAGRLSKELSGNIICVRCSDNRWTKEDAEKIMENKGVGKIKPLILTGQRNFYTNIERSLKSQPFTRKVVPASEQEYLNNFANILFMHEASHVDSILMNNFLKHTNAKGVLAKIDKTNKIDPHILEQSVTIKSQYQNRVLSKISDPDMKDFYPSEISYAGCYEFLKFLYGLYNWDIEESRGSNPMVKSEARLKYLAVLMANWMNSRPLNLIINNVIKHYAQEGQMWMSDSREIEAFDQKNRRHINMLINDLIYDIDNFLRFRIKNYVTNYELIITSVHGARKTRNWADYLEYGTVDTSVIALQNMGLSRHLANVIIDHHSDSFIVENGDVTAFNVGEVFQRLIKSDQKDEAEELTGLFGDQQILII